MVEMQSARLKRAGVARHLLEARDFSRVRLHAYMRFGGMPGIADVGLDQEKAMMLLEGIYSTVIMRDILERENRRGQKKITDAVLLKKIVLFLADNIGSSISVSSIGNTLVNEGLLEDGNFTKMDPYEFKTFTDILQRYSDLCKPVKGNGRGKKKK